MALFPFNHISVSLFLQGRVPCLTLYFPAKFENGHNPQFIDNSVTD